MSGEAEKTERAYVYMVRCAGGQLYTAGPMTRPAACTPTRAVRGPSAPVRWGHSGSRIWNGARTNLPLCAGKQP